MTEPEQETPYEPLTPIEVEAQLRSLTNHSRAGQQQMRLARAALAEGRKKVAIAKTLLSFAIADQLDAADCPPVGRGAGETTVAVRDAWVVRKTKAERLALQEAESTVRDLVTAMENARTFAHSVSEQLSAVQSIGASVREAYRGTGSNR